MDADGFAERLAAMRRRLEASRTRISLADLRRMPDPPPPTKPMLYQCPKRSCSTRFASYEEVGAHIETCIAVSRYGPRVVRTRAEEVRHEETPSTP